MKPCRVALVLLTVGLPMLIGCGPSTGSYEKMIMEGAVDGGVWGGAPLRLNDKGDSVSFPVLNVPIYSISEFWEVEVLEFGPIPGVSKSDIKSADVSPDGVLASASQRCALSVLYESFGTDDPTAILAEVSIGAMKKAPLNPEAFGRITINSAEIHESTRVWFIGHQRTAQFEGEEDYYNIAVGCFEDLDLFNGMIEIS